MSALTDAQRTELWSTAIAKAKELWGDQWAVAYNAEKLHTQCHVHVHIGKLLDGVEWGEFKVIDSPDQIPQPGADGLWIHPVNGKLHVHLGEQKRRVAGPSGGGRRPRCATLSALVRS